MLDNKQDNSRFRNSVSRVIGLRNVQRGWLTCLNVLHKLNHTIFNQLLSLDTTTLRIMSFTAEQLKAAEYGKNFAWDARKIPSEFDPVQLETGPSGVFDWWNTRGSSLCCFFPFLRCLSGHEKVDAKDLTHWKKQLASPSNKDCPE